MRSVMTGVVTLIGVGVGAFEIVAGVLLFREARAMSGVGSGAIGVVSNGCSALLPIVISTVLVAVAAVRGGAAGRILALISALGLALLIGAFYAGAASLGPGVFVWLPGAALCGLGGATLLATWLIARGRRTG